jgi:hypothetical protein
MAQEVRANINPSESQCDLCTKVAVKKRIGKPTRTRTTHADTKSHIYRETPAQISILDPDIAKISRRTNNKDHPRGHKKPLLQGNPCPNFHFGPGHSQNLKGDQEQGPPKKIKKPLLQGNPWPNFQFWLTLSQIQEAPGQPHNPEKSPPGTTNQCPFILQQSNTLLLWLPDPLQTSSSSTSASTQS